MKWNEVAESSHRKRLCGAALAATVLGLLPGTSGRVRAQDAAGVEPPKEAEAAPALAEAAAEQLEAEDKDDNWPGWLKIGAYAEAYYSWNFAKPGNQVTNNRWLDEKHNTFTLATVALDLTAQKGPFSGKVTLMFGPTADRWYFEGVKTTEDGVVLSPSGYNNETWKHLQIAYVGYKAPLGAGLTIQAGLFPTQVGYEGAAVKDNWNWSRSNLFNFLPFFHVGARVSYPITENLALTGAVYNGYNQATDLNGRKTLSLQASYVRGSFFANLMYMGGDERPRNDGAGKPWRNMLDLVAQYDIFSSWSIALHGNAGWEESKAGKHHWLAAALYTRVKATDWLYFAARGDGIFEKVPGKDPLNSLVILGADHVVSGTLTAEVRPFGDGVSFRLEYRHDDSDRHAPLFFKRAKNAGATQASAVQNTLTLGMTGWF